MTLLTCFVVMFTREWCYALDFLPFYVQDVSDVTLLPFFGEKHFGKKKLKNIQVLAAASLHRQPGLKAILNAMTVYRKDCLAGIVKLSASDAFKVAKLHWMSWNTRKKKLTCGQMAFRHIFPLEISRNHDKTPSFKQFQPTARQRFCAYIYIYINIYICVYIYIKLHSYMHLY